MPAPRSTRTSWASAPSGSCARRAVRSCISRTSSASTVRRCASGCVRAEADKAIERRRGEVALDQIRRPPDQRSWCARAGPGAWPRGCRARASRRTRQRGTRSPALFHVRRTHGPRSWSHGTSHVRSSGRSSSTARVHKLSPLRLGCRRAYPQFRCRPAGAGVTRRRRKRCARRPDPACWCAKAGPARRAHRRLSGAAHGPLNLADGAAGQTACHLALLHLLGARA
jgi:hypothetical protein